MKIEMRIGVNINEDGQLCVNIDGPAVEISASYAFTRADTLGFAVSIIDSRRDVDWSGVLAELAKKRCAT